MLFINVEFKNISCLFLFWSARFVERLGEDLTPSGASQPPFLLTPKIDKNSQKYIADPFCFYHKSSTVILNVDGFEITHYCS